MKVLQRHCVRYALLLALFISCLADRAQAQQGSAVIMRNGADNTPQSIRFDLDLGEYAEADIPAIFKKFLSIDGTKQQMVLVHTTRTRMGITTYSYCQYYKGIKAEQSRCNVVCKNGKVSYLTMNIYKPAAGLATVPAIKEAAALDIALHEVNALVYGWQDAQTIAEWKLLYKKQDTTFYPKATLVWIEAYAQGKGDRKMHLAYAFDIYAVAPLTHDMIYVDARTGAILYKNPLMHTTATTGNSRYSRNVPLITARLGATYMLYDSSRGNGIWTFNSNHDSATTAITNYYSPTNAWPISGIDSHAVDVHWGTEKIYDYLRTVHGRLSWDDADGILLSYVNYRKNPATGYDNAFWNGYNMHYGDGTGASSGGLDPVTSLDVAAHEIGHGICQATASLGGQSEPGAMNEGLSDCWGASVEHWADPHETDAIAKKYFAIGEEIKNGVGLRRMDTPNVSNNPDTYGGTNWYSLTACTPTSTNDYCGIHKNSTIISKWYYLIIQGEVGVNDLSNSYNVRGLGWSTAEAILYQTELSLTSTDGYAQARTASINAATTLYGACSREVESVTNAWYAVGVGAAATLCTPQIGFLTRNMTISENANTASCPASRTYSIGLRPLGAAITGGNPVVNVVAAYGSAVAGTDYSFSGLPITFTAGDTTTRYFTLTVMDNGVDHDNKNIALGISLTAMGSTAIRSPTMDSLFINIKNNDSALYLGYPEYHTLNAGTSTTCNSTSAFLGASSRAHSQFLLYASELNVAGVRPGIPITQLAFNVTSKYSTLPFTGYTVGMANVRDANLSYGYAGTPTTQVYTGNHTTNTGIDSIVFNTGTFTWDGTSNVLVEVCFGMNSGTASFNDQLAGISSAGSVNVAAFDYTNSGSGTGCALTPANYVYFSRPVMRFLQTVPPTRIETTASSTRTWNVMATTQNFFYSTADSELIATVASPTNALGCVSSTVSQAGTGFVASTFASSNRSLKEITITPTINGPTTTYNVTFYMTTTELNSVSPSTLYLLKTSATTDATINASNTTILTPTLITGTNFTGFRGTFMGFGRYFLVTNTSLCTAPTATITPGGSTTFCSGGNVVLTASSGTGYTYQWQVGGTNISGATNISYTATTGGNYTVVVSQGGCSTTSSVVTVTVNTAPSTPPAIGGATSACIGSPTTLTNSTGGGNWSSTNTTVATIHPTSGSVTPLAIGTTTISYTVSNSCGSAGVAMTFSVTATPAVASISGSSNVCLGGTTTLTDATTGGTWGTASASIATVNTSGTVTGAGLGTTNISYTVSGSCGSTTVTFSITTQPLPTTGTTTGTTTTCAGGTTALTNSVSGGAWSSSNTAIATVNSSTGAVRGVAAGTCNITYTLTSGFGCTASVVSTYTVTASGPTATITPAGSTTFCSGGSVVLNANTGTGLTYQWQIGGTNITGATSSSYTASVGGNYTVIVSNGSCSTTSSAVTVTVNTATPAAITGSTTVCVGATITLADATTGGSWSSSNAARATVTTGGVVTGVGAGTVTISYTVTGSCGTGSATTTITVSAPPTIAAITGTLSVCTGGTTALADATAGGTWSSSDTGIATVNASTGVVTGVSLGSCTITYSVTSGCSAFVTAGFTVNAGPTATITPAGSTTICVGSSVVLNAPTGTGFTYQWQYGGTNISGATGASYTASVGGTYNVIVRQGICVSTSAGVTVTVTTTPVASVRTTSTSGVCVGQSIVMTDSTTGGTWSVSSTSLATINSSTGVLSGLAAGTVTVSYSVTGSCGLGVATATVNVLPLPTVAAITGTASACVGGSAVTLANATAGGTWSSSTASVATINTTGSVTPVSVGTTTISYTVTGTNGCTNRATTAFTVNALPTVTTSASGTTTFCSGGYVVLSALAASATYQWQLGGTNITGATNSSYTASVGGNYTVVIRATGTGCSATSAATTVTVLAGSAVTPAVAIGATPGIVLCSGSASVSFTATPTNGGSAPTYQWYVNGTAVGSGGTSYSYTSADGDRVSCHMTSNATCAFPDSAVTTVTMTVSTPVTPSVLMSVLPSTTVCVGNTATFGAAPTGGGTSPRYTWYVNGVARANGSVYAYIPANGDAVYTTLTSNHPCRTIDSISSTVATMRTVAVSTHSVSITATRTVATSGTSITFTATSTGGGSSPSYQWYVDGVAVPGAVAATYTTTTLTNGQSVSCRVNSSDPCASPTLAASNNITVTITTGINGTAGNGNQLFSLMPNPNKGTFRLSGTLPTGYAGTVTVKIVNVLGQTIATTTATPVNGKIDETIMLSASVAAGVYHVTLITATATEVIPMIVE